MDYQKVRELPESEVEWLWINDYFDGPLQGIVEYDEKLCLCSLVEESENEESDGWFRKYAILMLSDDQLKQEKYWHAEFVKYVGDHFECNPDSSTTKVGATKPQSEWEKFYGPYKEKYQQNFSANEVLGWLKI